MTTTEKIEPTKTEPLPNGGAYAIATYHDIDGAPCSKGDATGLILVEYDERDRPISIITMDLND